MTTFPPLHRQLTWLVLAFLGVGQLALFSASGVLGTQRYGTEFYFVARQALCAVLALPLLVALSRTPYQKIAKFSPWCLAAAVLLVIASHLPGLGHHAQGASRWVRLGPVSFQPSEIAKVVAIIYFATCLAKHRQSPFKAYQWAIAISPLGVLLLLILRQPDLGTTVLLSSILLSLLFLSGVRLKSLLILAGAAGALFAYSLVSSPYRQRRLAAFLNPWADPQGNGFQAIQSFLSFHSGKVFGVGIGNGNSKLFFLPEVHTDFIFALIGEELGFAGTLAIVLLFVYFSYLLFKITSQAKDPLGSYIAAGLSLSLIFQILVNLGGVTGLIPVKGLPLPFLSWGRSALVVHIATIGILLNISRQSRKMAPGKP